MQLGNTPQLSPARHSARQTNMQSADGEIQSDVQSVCMRRQGEMYNGRSSISKIVDVVRISHICALAGGFCSPCLLAKQFDFMLLKDPSSTTCTHFAIHDS